MRNTFSFLLNPNIFRMTSWIFLIFILLFISCTENPFNKDTISGSDQREITGNVQLNDGSDPSGVLIWVKELNLYTFSENAGHYSIKIPEKTDSGPGGGITDAVTIYYYVSNYFLDSASAAIFDGSFQLDFNDVDSEGVLKNINLRKILAITTVVEDGLVIGSDGGNVDMRAIFTPAEVNTASITSWLSQDQALESFFIRGIDNDTLLRIRTSLHLTTRTFSETLILEGVLNIPPDTLSSGTYEVFPYVRVNQPLPNGLLKIYGSDPTSFSDAFVEIPVRDEKATIQVTNN